MDNKIIDIRLDSLRYDTANKVRCGIDDETIDRYTSRWQDYKSELKVCESQPEDAKTLKKPKYPFPPITVTKIESDGNMCCDIISGAHRARSATKAGLETIHAEIAAGSPDELVKMAISANSAHGKNPSADDVRKCIITLKEVAPDITSCRELAKLIGCSKSLVSRILKEMKEPDKPSLTTKAKNAGKAAAKPKAEPEDDVVVGDSVDEDESETPEPEEELQWWTPEWCDAALDTLQEIENPDSSTKESLYKLADAIVKFLDQHGGVAKSLKNKLAVMKLAK